MQIREMQVRSNYSGASAIEKMLLRKMLDFLGNPPVRITLWNGEELAVNYNKPAARMVIRDRKALLKLVMNPGLNFGDAYSEGNIDVEGNLVEFLNAVYLAMQDKTQFNPIYKCVQQIVNRPRRNTPAGSRENIHRHYDIGNDFYKLWLDDNMQYTCAYFSHPYATLEEAQIAKMDHVCRKLQLRPGESVVEAGCGWGGLARHMAGRYGVKVRAFNISREQVAYARSAAQKEGLSGQIEYVEDDYRNISGKFDAFVSVGMLEHVGAENYKELGRVINKCLAGYGRGLIHSIGRNRAESMNAWTEKRIFPGAYPPTIREMMDIFEPYGFSVIDVENLRLHYARTIEHWLDRFETAHECIDKMFDQKFIRTWRLYLAGSMVSFTTGWLQLFQVVFAHPYKNDIPWTRKHLYMNNWAEDYYTARKRFCRAGHSFREKLNGIM